MHIACSKDCRNGPLSSLLPGAFPNIAHDGILFRERTRSGQAEEACLIPPAPGTSEALPANEFPGWARYSEPPLGVVGASTGRCHIVPPGRTERRGRSPGWCIRRGQGDVLGPRAEAETQLRPACGAWCPIRGDGSGDQWPPDSAILNDFHHASIVRGPTTSPSWRGMKRGTIFSPLGSVLGWVITGREWLRHVPLRRSPSSHRSCCGCAPISPVSKEWTTGRGRTRRSSPRLRG
jgi:hypothetical protein